MIQHALLLTAAAVTAGDRSTEVLHNMGSGFRDKQENFHPAELILWLLVLVAAFWALNLISQWMTRAGRHRLPFNPAALFRALCKAHELDAGSARLLKHLAAVHHLDYASQIFLLPECFVVETLHPALRGRQAEIEALADKLFGPALMQAGSVHSAEEECLAIAREAKEQHAALLELYGSDASTRNAPAPIG